jgi:3-oxoacyl-(acyl-carrier-protein) synthase
MENIILNGISAEGIITESFSYIDKSKIVSPKGCVKREKPLSQISREEVYSQKHPAFGKLAFADKLAFCAAAVAIETATYRNPTECGILLLTNIGSFMRDKEFMRTITDGAASPAYFSATLPSSPIAEIAIVFGLKGANKIIFSGYDLAIQTTKLMLKECNEMLFVEINIPKDCVQIENSFAKAFLLRQTNRPLI